MKNLQTRMRLRLGANIMVSAMLAHTVVPAYAVVSQVPGLYITPPEVNVMFTLDDSGSMQSDVIPDFSLPTPVSYTGVPNNSDSNYLFSVRGISYPNMWGNNSSYWNLSLYISTSAVARYVRSSAGNPLYYDPSVIYPPWPQAANNALRMTPANPAAVNVHPDDPGNSGFTRNLTVRVGAAGEANGFWPATYYVYQGTTGLPFQTPNAALNTVANYTLAGVLQKFEITDVATQTFAKAATRTDCTATAGVCTRAEELQNFANWLQYYRNRRLMAKGAAGEAFSKQGSNLRAGFARLGKGGGVVRGVRLFTGTDRSDFFTSLYAETSSNGATPLRRAMDDVGQYFMTTDQDSPWAQTPGTSVGTEYTCRRSFHVLSTDGLWNGAQAPTAAARANNDDLSGNTPAKPDGTTYAYSDAAASEFGINPFKDGNSNTLADVAAYYWKTDLRPTLANNVIPSTRDPAFWQHLTTFTVGLGITGSNAVTRNSDGTTTVPTVAAGNPLFPYIGKPWLANQGSRDWLVANKVVLDWTLPANDNPATGDDLIHASMNGHGRYFSATNPGQLAGGLASALAEATDSPGSLANVVTETPAVATTTEVYQGVYNPDKWSGRLYAFSQSASGAVNTKPTDSSYTNPTQMWEASNKMPLPANRNIYTWNPGTSAGSSFTWTDLTGTQRTSLGSSDVLDFLRGSDAKEAAQGGSFRDRSRYTVAGVTGGVLGDIVNGSPIKGPSAGAGYDRLPSGTAGQGTYKDYRLLGNTALDNMRNTLFAGANDGMLHAFDRNTGEERFAYVPNSVYSVPRSPTATELKLKMLSDPGYTHRFTVDGPPQIGDGFIGPSAAAAAWKTLLLSSTGAGARSVFTMDITNPKVETGGFSKSSLLWEFSDADTTYGNDMGFVINYPHIARMRDGTWVSIFGNGYDSVNGQATLFIRNLQTGAHVWKVSVGAAGGNGLSQPNFTVNANREVTAIYAGDLKGSLWKFDVNDANPANWKVAFGTAATPTPLYTGSTNQPITVMPEITFHPNGGTLLSFGTGKLFEVEDTATTGNINLNTQAIYGIWDKPSETAGISGNTDLVQQSANGALGAVADTSLSGTTTNTIDWTSKRGWYMNLLSGGERVNVNPLQAKSTLLVVANTPDSDPCKSGGTSRLFALDPITGGAPNFAVFDTNGVGGVNSADAKGYNVKSISFAVLSLPALQSKKAFTDQVVKERAGTRGQTGERLGGVENIPPSASDCAQWLLAGGSNTAIAGFDISLCKSGTPRVSWRQLK